MTWFQSHGERRWPEYLLAILLGNAIYLLLAPRLPEPLQHRAFQIDLGLAVDFALCLGVYAAAVWARRKWFAQ